MVWRQIKACLMAVAVSWSSAVGGGESRVGTNAAPELLVPVGARDVALAGADIATTSGIEAIYWNPAGLARGTTGSSAMFSHMNYIADIGVEYVAASTGFEGVGMVGVSLKSLSVGDIPVTTDDQPDGTGATISPTIVNLGLTYARLLTDRISLGVTGTLISERFDKVSATGFGLSAGVQYNGLGGVHGLSVGAAVKNIGTKMQFQGDGLLRTAPTYYEVTATSNDLPSTIEIGLSYAVDVGEQNSLNLNGMFQNNDFSSDEYKVGLEYGYNNTFFVRGGYSLAESGKNTSLDIVDQTTFIYGFAAGAGVHYPVGGLDLSFDYAFRAVNFFQNNHVFAVKVGF